MTEMNSQESRECPRIAKEDKTMKRARLWAAQLIVAILVCASQALAQTSWWRTYGGVGADRGYSVQQTADGGYVIVGFTSHFGRDVYLIKTNAQGETLWTKTFGGTSDDYGYSVQQTTDDGYVLTGSTGSFGAGYEDVYLIKTDANGNVAVAETSTPQLTNPRTAFRVQPNPFSSFAVVPGHEAESFILSDVSGRKVDVCNGNRIGAGLPPGVYFLSPVKPVIPHSRPFRIVKGG